jgi:small-conductance mechanosensitive channel
MTVFIYNIGYSIKIHEISASNEEYAQNFTAIQNQINTIKLAITNDDIFDNDLLYYRQQLREIDDRLDQASDYYQNNLTKLERIVHLFSEDEKNEGESVYNEKLNTSIETINEFKGRLFEIKIVQTEVQNLLANISEIRTEIRNKDLFVNNEPLYDASAWQHGMNDIGAFTERFKIESELVFSNLTLSVSTITILCIFFICLIYLLLAKRIYKFLILRVYKAFKRHEYSQVKYLYQFIYLLIVGFIPALLVYILFENIADLSTNLVWSGFYNALASSLGLFCLLYFLTTNLLFKSYNYYVPGGNTPKLSSKLLFAFLIIISMLFFINNIQFFSLKTIISPYMGPDGTAIIDFILGLILSVILIGYAIIAHFSGNVKENKYARRYKWASALALFIAVFYPLMTFLGSSNLSSGVLLNILQTFVLVYIARIIYRVIDRLIPIMTYKITSIIQSNPQKDNVDSENEGNNFTDYWLSVIFGAGVAFIILIAVLLVWGIQPERLYDWFEFFFIDGIPIGQDGTFSLLYLINAILVLVGFYYATKFIQVIVDKRVLPYTNIDSGTKHAIRTTIGYVGLALSIVMFIYALGVNSTTLTFVISGLSVGIGFALQDLFKNFFAGFVLLIERPIKVGDWVNVENDIGEVKRIRIRATVIETFNKNTLIIPNSSFVNSIVSNETLNPMSRAVVEIGVPYDADPTLVLDVMKDVAAKSPRVYTQPEPSVIFNRIDNSALIFTLRGFVNKAEQIFIETELRISIIKALKEHGINLPHIQQNIVLKSDKNID